jgi:hypothetical protein
MAAPRRPKKKAKPPEHSVTLIASEDSRPIGWMPPSFPPDYVAGSIAPFFLAGSYIGATPLLPMIDLSLTKQGGVPGKGRPKVEMTNSAFGAVYSKIDGTPHPVVDTAGYAPFGFGYRRCAGEHITVEFIKELLRKVWREGSPSRNSMSNRRGKYP